MKVMVKTGEPALFKTPALIVFLFEEDKPSLASRPELAGLQEVIAPRLRKKDFEAKHLAVMTIFTDQKPRASTTTLVVPERIVLMGLGAEKDCGLDKLRSAAAKAVQTVQDLKIWSAAILWPPIAHLGEVEDVAEAMVFGARLGTYQYTEFKVRDKERKKPVQYLTLLQPQSQEQPRIRKAVETARVTAQAVAAARDLVNRPSNVLHPEALAEEAKKLAEEVGLKVRILDEDVARRKGMGAFLGVCQGSRRPGRVIVLEYKGAGTRVKPIALVGKAITFDSGGLCLKPPDNMKAMKTDMAGGAAVLSVMGAAAQMKLKCNLVGIVPATENMPGGEAYRPGDVLVSLSGQTIEVVNTDAEGRLILADALTLALEYKPRAIIDLATLTGACVIALGNKCAGLMSNNEELRAAIEEASRATGERVWPLPLFDDYAEDLKSEVADCKHVGTRAGGALTAALFLRRFVGDIPWAHLDIAGPARIEKGTPDIPKGGTGFGVYLLLKYLKNL